MTKKKKDEDVVVDQNAPIRKCINCIHWHILTVDNEPEAVDISTGVCDHNGYSKCPPVFTCNGWASEKGALIDKMGRK